jgi:hypothetical protein
MKVARSRIFLAALTIPFLLAACGQDVAKLPDDPDNELISSPSPENGTGSSPGADPAPVPQPSPTQPLPPPVVETPDTEREEILALYGHLDPQKIVPTTHLENAVVYFHLNKSRFTNQRVISILDFTQSSRNRRWYFVNMQTGSVWNIHVAHGKGSDREHDGFAERFSNIQGSNTTSLGAYRTAETYSGRWGYSLRLDGLSDSNSQARRRAIVVHGADYVRDQDVIQGRSWGCPAVSLANSRRVIDLIKEGSLIFAVGQVATQSESPSRLQ